MNRAIRVACGLVFAAASLLTANAQDASLGAFEGHVYDAKTLRPLEFAFIQYDVALPNGAAGSLATTTDVNGFYQIEFIPPSDFPTSTSLQAYCNTRRGRVSVEGRLYYPLRTDRYRRDFYISLPKGVTRCNPIQ